MTSIVTPIRAALFLLFTLSLLFTSAAFANTPAQERTTQLLDTFKSTTSAPEGKSLTDAQKASNDKIYLKIDGFFDLNTFATQSIASSKDAFSPPQLEHFLKTFKDLVRIIAYPDSGAFLREAKYTIGPPIKGAGFIDVTVSAELEAEDLEMDITFRWREAGGTLVVQDVLFDEDSLVLEYQNQFKKVITKKGVDGLLKTIDKKHAEITALEKREK